MFTIFAYCSISTVTDFLGTEQQSVDWIDLLAFMVFHLSLEGDCKTAELLDFDSNSRT